MLFSFVVGVPPDVSYLFPLVGYGDEPLLGGYGLLGLPRASQEMQLWREIQIKHGH